MTACIVRGFSETKPNKTMKNIVKYVGLPLAGIFMMNATASADHHGEKKAIPTVVEIAASNDDFSTLVAAVKAADLVEALSSDGPFTIFAPTNDAFKALSKGVLENLLKPENKAKLAAILKYHVISGKVMAKDVKPMKVKTLQGTDFEIKVIDGTVMVDGAKVIKTDIVGKNGVIHVIDKVIQP